MRFLPFVQPLAFRVPGAAALASGTLLGLALVMAAAPTAAQQCHAAGGGPPCETATGAASLGDPDGTDVTVGNPIHPITGNKYQEEVDSPALPGLFGLEIRRHFNSSYVSADGPWGKGWSMSYDTRVHRTAATLQIIQADGRRLIFGLPPGKVQDGEAPMGPCSPAGPGQGQLFVEPHGYRWVWPQQRELLFDQHGSLVRISPRGAGPADSLTIERAADGRITRVTDPASRTMRFNYDTQGYLSRIDHPLGRWQYRINAGGRIESVTAPDGAVRSYRYEDPGHPSRFTAITIAGIGTAGTTGTTGTIGTIGIPEQVIGQWWYDAQGRADRYRRGDGSELRLAYEQTRMEPARTGTQGRQEQRGKQGGPATAIETTSVLINAMGGRTEYKAVEIAGKWRVTEIRGPGCQDCGPTNLRMRYDAQGQLLARAAIQGGGVAYVRDRFGRVVRAVRLERWEDIPNGSRPPADPSLSPGISRGSWPVAESQAYLQRFEYPDDQTRLPRVIARPSVVPGKEHQVIVDRDDRGNVTRLVQTGFAPEGFPGAGFGPQPIVRTWHLRYEDVAGKRVLAQVDGPLPNGPAGDPSDSDITVFRYDDEGRHLTAAQMPGGSLRRVESRDLGGRPLVIAMSDGHREFQERLTYNLQGQVLHSDTSARFVAESGNTPPDAAQRTSHRFDLRGLLVESVDSAGRVIRHQHDAAGRPVGVGDQRGYRSVLTRDPEGRVLVAALHRPGLDEPLRATYYGRDEDGRLLSLLLADGRRYRFHYDALGQPVGFSDEAGLLQLILPAGEAPASGSAVVDDFGQVLRQALPDHGVDTMRYDEAGRVVESNDAAGVRTRYRYDAAGRLLARAMTDGLDEVTYTYDGLLLGGVDDPAQVIRYRRDARGRVIESTTTLRGLAGPPMKLSRAYDPGSGLSTVHGLAGGETLQVIRTGADEGAVPRQLHLRDRFWTCVVEQLRLWLPENLARAVADLLPRTAVARAIEVHPFDGLTGFIHHNGIAVQRQFDPVGRTSRLRSGSEAAPVSHWRYAYGAGSRIKTIEHLNGMPRAGAAARHMHTFGYHPDGALGTVTAGIDGVAGTPVADPSGTSQVPHSAVRFDKAGRVVADSRFRYAYSGLGQVETVHDLKRDRRVASYAYNYRGQRVRKVVYDEDDQPASTRYYLWNDRRLVAEVEPDGTFVAQFLSLDDGRRDLPIAVVRPRGSAGRGSGDELTALHADHRGAPVAMTDAQQRVTWRADLSPSGVADVKEQRQGAELNLRLPGQYRDAETGLHDNWHRTYDPSSGRYLQPDPLGYPSGLDAYTYAGGDPVNRTDPYGLYEIDVHYYMTFFLGVTAGLDPQEARIVALAAQYVDDNPLTRPMDSTHLGTTLGSVFQNQQRLLGYHFVLSGTDGRTLPDHRNSRLSQADSPQLRNLFYAARSSGIGRNASLQFLGEYLHALADTYSHRDAANHPYDALLVNCGIGHGHAMHEPDKTYDDVPASPELVDEGRPPARQAWRREARTLRMESSLHNVLLAFGDPGKAKRFQEIEAALREFNAIRESERGGAADFAGKMMVLQKELARLGYGELELATISHFRYDVDQAGSNRRRFLTGLNGEVLTEDAYPGVCLEGGSRCNSN